jgi:hypothetical protein
MPGLQRLMILPLATSKAAKTANHLPRSINIFLGLVLSAIGLTIRPFQRGPSSADSPLTPSSSGLALPITDSKGSSRLGSPASCYGLGVVTNCVARRSGGGISKAMDDAGGRVGGATEDEPGDLAIGLSLLLGLFAQIGDIFAILRAVTNILIAGGAGPDTIGFNVMLITAGAIVVATGAGRRYGIDATRWPSARFLRLLT